MVLVDWAGAGRGPRLWSLAFLLFAEAMKEPRRAGAVLAGYCRHVTLTSDELDRLAEVARARPLLLAAWAVGNGRMTPSAALARFAQVRTLTERMAARIRAALAS